MDSVLNAQEVLSTTDKSVHVLLELVEWEQDVSKLAIMTNQSTPMAYVTHALSLKLFLQELVPVKPTTLETPLLADVN